MCGIAGFFSRPSASAHELQEIAARMAGVLIHRGPDDAGVWVDEAGGIALGFSRLAILDLSAMGHQPMVSRSGRFVLAFNGEIYNFPALRERLTGEGVTFRGHSDTEVALAAFERFGIADALARLNGMFAIALWDRRDRELHLMRDKFGEKPLYYGWSRGSLFFGSELKALRQHPDFAGEIDAEAVADYFRLSYVPAPRSIYRDVFKLPPGCWLTLGAGHAASRPEPRSYWSAARVAIDGQRATFPGSDDEAVAALDDVLRQSVRDRMIADVPLGAFLSGGIDSSAVVALMQAQSTRPVQTFTIGSEEAGYDEARDAKAVARHLGTEHTELYVRPSEALALVPRLASIYDEPFADSSQIPTLLVSALARRSVTVALSGDGGDELFGGYNRYLWAERIRRCLGQVPYPARATGARLLTRVAPDTWNRWLLRANPVLPRGWQVRNVGEKIHKLAAIACVRRPAEMYDLLVATFPRPGDIVRASPPVVQPAASIESGLDADSIEWMMCRDTVTYLPDDILAKVDRASMSVSLEVRVPMLDPEVFAFAWRLPRRMRLRGSENKWLLRRVLERYVPAPLFDRPKMGFAVPIGSWLRGPLRGWAEDLLDDRRIREDGWLAPDAVRRLWTAHLGGTGNWQYQLWTVLMFQAFLSEQRPGKGSGVRDLASAAKP